MSTPVSPYAHASIAYNMQVTLPLAGPIPTPMTSPTVSGMKFGAGVPRTGGGAVGFPG
jgi:hypothetical protein